MAKNETTVVAASVPTVEGEVQTNTARRQDLVESYYKGVKNENGEYTGLSVGAVAEKHNVRISDVYAALRDAATDAEAKAELARTCEYFITRGE